MPRNRTIPDQTVLNTVRQMLASGGDKAVSFSTVAQATGLAASTLAQRYATRDGMVRAALLDGWDRLIDVTVEAETEAPMSAKGVPALLKRIGRDGGGDLSVLVTRQTEADLRNRAEDWRRRMESAIALRLGNDDHARDSASMVFAAWQGRLLWGLDSDSGFRLKDAIKRLG
ncbi:MAG: transcriptional regulator [Paracoccaceae bacterium]|nr:transcriptional regulator [Paracoccaceae bacterium]